MSLGNPVIELSNSRWKRDSRSLELAAALVITVAVVVVAALLGPTAADDDIALRTVDALPAATSLTVASTQRATAGSSAAAADQVLIEQTSVSSETAESTLGVSSASIGTNATPDVTELPMQTGIVPGQPDPAAPALPDSFERYQVQRGESLFLIASARGVTVSELAFWNWQLEEDSTLIRGEWIWIPRWSESSVSDGADESVEEGKSGRGGG